jgi:hypothetical protein
MESLKAAIRLIKGIYNLFKMKTFWVPGRSINNDRINRQTIQNDKPDMQHSKSK